MVENCNDPSNPCAGVSGINYDAAVTACMSRLGIDQGQPLSVVLSELASAICELMDAAELTCEGVLIPGTYSNIGFTGDDTTTLCDLIDAIDTKFENILNTEISDCFGTASTLYEAITETRTKLCDDLYTANEWLFLPLAGNSTTALQAAIHMVDGASISWYHAFWTSPPYIYGLSSDGVHISGGQSTIGNVYPITLDTPIKSTLAPRVSFSVLTAANNNLLQNTMKPQYYVDKSSVNAVNLPDLSGMIIPNPVVMFTATAFAAAASNCKIYPFAGQTIQLVADFNMSGSNVNWVYLMGDGLNWRIMAQG